MDLKAFPVPSHWEMRKCGWMRQEIEEVRVRQSEIFLNTLVPYIYILKSMIPQVRRLFKILYQSMVRIRLLITVRETYCRKEIKV